MSNPPEPYCGALVFSPTHKAILECKWVGAYICSKAHLEYILIVVLSDSYSQNSHETCHIPLFQVTLSLETSPSGAGRKIILVVAGGAGSPLPWGRMKIQEVT